MRPPCQWASAFHSALSNRFGEFLEPQCSTWYGQARAPYLNALRHATA